MIKQLLQMIKRLPISEAEQQELIAISLSISEQDTVSERASDNDSGSVDDESSTGTDSNDAPPKTIQKRVLPHSEKLALQVLLPERYSEDSFIASGGMGAVFRVCDTKLNTMVAMKVLHSHFKHSDTHLVCFENEAQIVAQLQHPNIPPVHDYGVLKNGLPFFTMQEIHGVSLRDVIYAYHYRREDEDKGWTLGRLIDIFIQVCKAMAYAHEQGVIHRDLKPSNVMVGDFGSALVVDWGLAKLQGTIDMVGISLSSQPEPVDHAVEGTPAYMSPEQARGDLKGLSEKSDIYSLGSILYLILSGRKPYAGNNGLDVLQQVISGPPESLLSLRNAGVEKESVRDIQQRFSDSVPQELVEICNEAMERDVEKRMRSVSEMLERLQAWLDGSKKREKALSLLEKAVQLFKDSRNVMMTAQRSLDDTQEELREIPMWVSEQHKRVLWQKEDTARQLQNASLILKIRGEQFLQSALTYSPQMIELHVQLLKYYKEEHFAAYKRKDAPIQQMYENRLHYHLGFLPTEHTQHQIIDGYLRGAVRVGIQSLPGARIALYEYRTVHRRLVPQFTRYISDSVCELPRGSYCFRVSKPGFRDTLYPVFFDRTIGGHQKPYEIRVALLAVESLKESEVFVPAGMFICGGDPDANDSLPQQEVFVDGFIIQRFPVTNREYLLFLNDLNDRGLQEEALKHVPRERSGQLDREGAQIYGWSVEDGFYLKADSDGDCWDMEWPVVMIGIQSACSYAEWYAQKEKLSWRLPTEFEWEKAARGVDGRIHPWGNFCEPSWASNKDAREGRPLPARVQEYPIDESPYGVRSMVGNISEWTASVMYRDRHKIVVEAQISSNADLPAIVRGGTWTAGYKHLHCAQRYGCPPSYRGADIGFRLVRSWRGTTASDE